MPDWAQIVAGFVEVFGSGVRVTNLRLASAPRWQLGESTAERIARTGGYLETYTHNMPGFGPPVEETTIPLPVGWKRHGETRALLDVENVPEASRSPVSAAIASERAPRYGQARDRLPGASVRDSSPQGALL